MLDDLFVVRSRKKYLLAFLITFPLPTFSISKTFNDKVEITNTSDFAFIHDEADGDSVPLAFDMGFDYFAIFSFQQKFILNRLLVIYQELLAN